MFCENCGQPHVGSYGSGRFCGAKCARGFSTKGSRESINLKVSSTLKAKHANEDYQHPQAGKPGRKHTEETKQRIGRNTKKALKDKGITIDREAFIQEWLGGKVSSEVLERRERMIREWLIQQAGDKCPECGWGERHPTTGKVPLQIDHIDGDHFNNQPDNVRILCPNCHSLTENFMRLNPKGKARRRRERSE